MSTPELFTRIDVVVSRLEERFDAFERRVDQRFDCVDQRFDCVDQRFDRVDRDIKGVHDRLDALNGRTRTLEVKSGRHALALTIIGSLGLAIAGVVITLVFGV